MTGVYIGQNARTIRGIEKLKGQVRACGISLRSAREDIAKLRAGIEYLIANAEGAYPCPCDGWDEIDHHAPDCPLNGWWRWDGKNRSVAAAAVENTP